MLKDCSGALVAASSAQFSEQYQFLIYVAKTADMLSKI